APLPAGPPGLADLDVDVLGIAELAHGGAALEVDAPDLAGRQPDLAPVALFRHELRGVTRRSGQLAAGPDLELDVVDRGAERDVAQRQRVAGLDVGRLGRDYLVADREVLGRQDVALLAVRVVEQRDARRAVRIVLDGRDLGRHADLVALEVDDPVAPLVAAAAEARRGAPVAVAATGRNLLLDQRLLGLVLALRDAREVLRGHAAPAGRGGFVLLDRHLPRLPRRAGSPAQPPALRSPSSSAGACRRSG